MSGLRIIVVATVALLLCGCQSQKLIGSIDGGECKVMERPQYEVRGVAVYDQRWIDRQIEGGVGACKWKRPDARPLEIDKAPAMSRAPHRQGLIKRIKAAVLPKEWPERPAAPVVVAPVSPPPKVDPPCARVDHLLHRCGAPRVVYPQ